MSRSKGKPDPVSDHSPSVPGDQEPLLFIQAETQWRQKPLLMKSADKNPPRISLTHWSTPATTFPYEVSTDATGDSHLLTFSFTTSRGEFSFDGVNPNQGHIEASSILITGPAGGVSRGTFFKPARFFRIYLPQGLIGECYAELTAHRPPSDLVLFEPQILSDRIIRLLTTSLVGIDEDGGPFGPAFLDSIGLALTSRLVALHLLRRLTLPRAARTPLAPWRLQRVVDYVESHLSDRISLSDMSEAAGLSRMHFAAQFRLATGVSPHSYIITRKVERAKQLLLDQAFSIVDIALLLGFSSQAHFTQVFKKAIGDTPHRWRQNSRNL
jgi:AraC family transcriptional regulator